MNRRLALWTALAATLVVTLMARGALAQEVTIGYQGLPYKMTGETNTGIQVAEGVLLHVGAGVEGGYDSNVFYSNTNLVSSPILRTSMFGEMTNATRTGAATRLTFDLRAGLTYRRYESDDVMVAGNSFKNAWMPTAGVAISAGGGQFGFGLADTFARIEDPPYSTQTLPILRYNNQASAEGRWAPGGGRLTATLRYTNMLDIFTGFYDYATADYNYLMVDAAWKWLPKTAIFVNVQQGYVFYLNDTLATGNNKTSSYPLMATAGLRGLLTEKTSALLQLGYTNGFYSGAASTNGFLGSTYAEVSLSVRPTMLSRVVLGFRHSFVNAVISSFSYNETAYASYVQQIAGRLALDLSGRYVHSKFGGLFVDPVQMATGRTDDFFQAGASLDYFIRNWIYAGVAYSLLNNGSNIPTAEYLKQQVFVRAGVTY
jgi:hypothetical protein